MAALFGCGRVGQHSAGDLSQAQEPEPSGDADEEGSGVRVRGGGGKELLLCTVRAEEAVGWDMLHADRPWVPAPYCHC